MNTDDDADETSQPPRPRSVKRGAFPTPKSEIEKAPVFVPPSEDADDRPQPEAPQPPEDAEDPDDAEGP
jgi:hypothetical protein